MAEELSLPKPLKQARWKVKIQDKERVEPPHVTILRGTDKWRMNLRTRKFMDRTPKPSEVPNELLDYLKGNWDWACHNWDEMYPDNTVERGEQ